ncbi:hypothetical protein [Pseudalkalibacillus decolorationis]|uniref:hypothetical protein n=1 Tax=Pseudalkalibacillus decolorationis TaxID=163879 RepID=UPI0021474E92|nr:hypothetical protein [Pseudalkalibacillus decolorationis]
MTAEQILTELKQFLVANRDHARGIGGKFNRTSTTLDRVLEKLQELDPTITDAEIYYNGTEFYPENYNMLPKA